ncbi:hypothetical protein L345_16404, partial [Ophiophagus hannah]
MSNFFSLDCLPQIWQQVLPFNINSNDYVPPPFLGWGIKYKAGARFLQEEKFPLGETGRMEQNEWW